MKKNLLFVFDYFESGGGTRLNICVVRALSKKYNIYFLCGKAETEIETLQIYKELNKYCKDIFTYDLSNKKNDTITSLTTILKSFKTFNNAAKKINFDLIIYNLTYSTLGVFLSPLSKGIKRYYFFHGFLFLERQSYYAESMSEWDYFSRLRFKIKNKIIKYLQIYLMQKCNKILAFSTYSKYLISNQTSIGSKVSIINPPIFAQSRKIKGWKKEKFKLGDNDYLIVVASRIEPRKGIHLLMDSVNLIKKLPLRVIVIGSSYQQEYYNKLLKLVSENELFGVINFLGNLNHNLAVKLIANADLTLMPSQNYETLGYTTLESLLHKTPVIGFNTGATPENLSSIDKRLIATKITGKHLAKRVTDYLALSVKEKVAIKTKCHKYVAQKYSPKIFLNTISNFIDKDLKIAN